MAIVRELLIKLGFQTDKKAVNETNQAITGFKTRFAIAAGAATYAFAKVSQFFANIATATLDAKDLADTLGISLRELVALQTGFSNFRINDNQVSQILSGLNSQLQGLLSGENRALDEIAARTGIVIDRTGNAVDLFRTILTYIARINSGQGRIKVARDFFGEDLAPRIVELSQNLDKFDEIVRNSDFLGQKAEDSVSSLKRYEDAINALSEAWKQFGISLSQTVVPILTTILGILKYVLDFYRDLSEVFSNFNLDPLKKTLQDASKAIDESALGRFINMGRRVIGDNINSDLYDPEDTFRRYGVDPNPAIPSFNVVNNIEVNASGSNEEQARFMSEEISQRVEDTINDSWRKIQNNNPMVE